MATDNRGEVHLLSETAAVLLVGEEIHGQRQTAPGQYRDQTLVSERTDETIERRGEICQMTAHSSKLSSPCIASKALRATSGCIRR